MFFHNNLVICKKVCNFARGLDSPAAVTSVIAPSDKTTVLPLWALREGDGKLEEVRRPANIIRKSIIALVG